MKRWLFFSVAKFLLVVFPAVVLAWPIPDTGHTKCYESDQYSPQETSCVGTGQDGEFLINPSSYTKLDTNGNDLPDTATEWMMVRDNVTGLIWEVKQNKDDIADYTNPHDAENRYSWYDPNLAPYSGMIDHENFYDTSDFLNALNTATFGGYADWRLPTPGELLSIAFHGSDYGEDNLDTTYFPNAPEEYKQYGGSEPVYYWSSTPSYYNKNYLQVFVMNLDFPHTCSFAQTGFHRAVRAVRGGQAVSFGRFVINGNDTVTDTKTGLMWGRSTEEEMEFDEALSHCETITTASYGDWRLPNIKELASILSQERFKPAIDTEYFPDSLRGEYWSSGAYTNRLAYVVDFSWIGGISTDRFNGAFIDSNFVRPVRGGQNQIPGNLVISTPRQASFWNIDSTVPVTWDTAGIPGNVKISISSEGGRPGTYRTIAESTPNDGAYDWTIAGKPSYNCMLKIEPLSDPSKGTVQGLFTVLYYLYATPSSFGLVEPTAPDETPESKTFRVKLTRDPGGEVALDIASSNPGECTVSPGRIVMDSGNWNAGVEITVTPEYDGFADGDQFTSVLASTTDSLAAFQAVDFPLVQVIVQDSDTETAIYSVSPAYGEAGQPLAVTMEGANFTSSTPVFILPDGGAATQISPVTFVNDTTLSFTIPAQSAGNYTLRADAFDLESAVAFTDSTAIAAQGRKKAIIAAGSGPFFDNGFWLATDKCATHAYETLVSLGYGPADIQFLSAALEKDVTGNGDNDVDADATLATLQAAIDALTGAETDELLLYLVGPSANGQFQFGDTDEPEYLAPATLDSWLDALQGRISGQVVVVVDTPQSGGFLPALGPPAGKERVAITATNADEAAWFLNDGEISFSYRLFSHLFDNSELFSAFDNARDDISMLQTPQIDATGDGVPDLRRLRDGQGLAIGRGRSVEISPPDIAGFSADPPLLDDGSVSASLSASGVQAPSGLSRIWARLIPPIQVLRNPALPVLTAPAVKLFDLDSDGVYEGESEEFIYDGQYRALAYAVDRAGAKSFPRETTVTQTEGIPMPILPGDVNNEWPVDLADAIQALQIVVGMQFEDIRHADADADGDDKIGLGDAIFILQTVGKMRP